MPRLRLSRIIIFVCAGFALWAHHASANAFRVPDKPIEIGSHHTLSPIAAYRFEKKRAGSSTVSYTTGAIAVSEDDSSIYIAGHARDFSIGSFTLPASKQLGDISSLPILELEQPFVAIAPHKARNSADRIVGIETLGEQLLVSTNEYYDANANNKENLVVFANRRDLKSGEQYGFYSFSGRSHAAGWMGKLPDKLASVFGDTHYAGASSNLPINSRLSIGPSLFTWFPYFLDSKENNAKDIVTIPIIDYSLAKPLHNDNYNKTGTNSLWTELSSAVYGFFTPDHSYYLTIGYSGGLKSGIGYKITQDNGKLCGGPCAYNHDDYYNFFWSYSVQTLIDSKNNKIKPHEVKPIEHGQLEIFNHRHLIIGADFNPGSNRLYILIGGADTSQGRFSKLPILMVYKLNSR